MSEHLPIGAALKGRREDLDVTQSLVAWAARVSRNTVGNVERGQGEPEDRVISNISAVLGANRKRLIDPERQSNPYILPKAAVRRIFEIITDRQAEGKVQLAREMADKYVAWLIDEAEEGSVISKQGFLAHHGKMLSFIDKMAPYISPFEDFDTPLIQCFIERGWSLEDSPKLGLRSPAHLHNTQKEWIETGDNSALDELKNEMASLRERTEEVQKVADSLSAALGLNEGHSANLAVYLNGAEAFARLPARLQSALLSGHVADYEILEYAVRDKAIQLMTMVIRPDDAGDLSAIELARAMGRWTSTIALASSLVTAGGEHNLDLEEIAERVESLLHDSPARELEMSRPEKSELNTSESKNKERARE